MPTSQKVRPGANQGSRPQRRAAPEAALRESQHLHGEVDLLVTDVVMPGLGGRDLVAHVRDTYPDLRVLFVSGYTEEGVRRHGVLGTPRGER